MSSGLGRATWAEHESLIDARHHNPKLGQRTLAKKLYEETAVHQCGRALRFRSRAAIYGMLRTYDTHRTAVVTKAVAAAEHSVDDALSV